MQKEDIITRIIVAILIIGCIIAIMPWWLILILLSPFLYMGYLGVKMWWKFHQLKKMAQQQQDPFQQYQQQQQQYQQQRQQANRTNNVHNNNTGNKKRVFDDNEGEYVDFEEVR